MIKDFFSRLWHLLFGKNTSNGKTDADLKDELRTLTNERNRKFEDLDVLEEKIQALGQINSRKAQADLYILKEDLNAAFDTLAVLNASIRQIKTMLRLKADDEMAQKIAAREMDMRKLIAKKEANAVIIETSIETMEEAGSVHFADPTMTKPATDTQHSMANPQKREEKGITPSQETEKKTSEIVTSNN